MNRFKKFSPFKSHLLIKTLLFFYGIWLFHYDSKHNLSDFISITVCLILPSLIYLVIKNLTDFYFFKTNYHKNIKYSGISRIISQLITLLLAPFILLFTAMLAFTVYNLLFNKDFSFLVYFFGALYLFLTVNYLDLKLVKNKDSVSFLICLLVLALIIILFIWSFIIDVKYSSTINAIFAILFLFLDRKNLVRISGKDLIFGKETTDKFLFILKILVSAFIVFSIFSSLIIPKKTVHFNKSVSEFLPSLMNIGPWRFLITGLLVIGVLLVVLGVQKSWSEYVDKQNGKLVNGNKYYRLHKKSRKR